jgi:hydroxypyruvate isomerase
MTLFSVHLGYVLGSLPLPDRFSRAHELGFRAVEMPFPYATPAEVYADLLARHGLQQISIGAPTTDFRNGEPGLAVDYRARVDFERSLEQAASYAKRIGCPAVHVFSGCKDEDLSPSSMDDTYRENLARAVRFFSDEDILTLIEPINAKDFPGYFLDSLDMALDAIVAIGSPELRLIFDVYHLSMMGLDILEALNRAHAHVQHIQFADFPGRHEPGEGTLDFDAIVDAMRAVSYRGSAGLEYIPTKPVMGPFTLPPALARYAGLVCRQT